MGMVTFASLLSEPKRSWLSEQAVFFLNMMFLWSWCAVIQENGDIPTREPGQIYVANHSSVRVDHGWESHEA